eukprot:GHVL01033927.1.p2 GENE.GHVL01033927.1~~GHVL01033927.1.p2  ORF type:complete len:258 (-),score=48.93 GHVL01033927.1:182-955(-)
MMNALKNKEIDLAVVLYEGIVADIVNGSNKKIIATYVKSPLTWGVHTSSSSNLKSIDELKGRTFGVSRMGSGSHLMAVVMALQRGWKNDIKFSIIGNMDGASEAFKRSSIDAFMWEKYTSKHKVDSGEWNIVGEETTPWSCFVVAAREEFLKDSTNVENSQKLLEITQSVCKRIMTDKEEWVKYFADNYKNSIDDARQWLNGVEWACSDNIDLEAIEKIIKYLKEAEIITCDENFDLNNCIFKIRDILKKNDDIAQL